MRILGIDPGLSGALVVLDTSVIVAVIDAPTIKMVKAHRTRSELDVDAMVRAVGDWATGPTMFAVIEMAETRPHQSITSALTTGIGMGIWEGILAAYRLPRERVLARTWKAAMRIPGGPEGKGQARKKAAELFPAVADKFKRVEDHGRAEAALIAEYARRTWVTPLQDPPREPGVWVGDGKVIV
jgi:crossover junction endodeoxyribonuclease RuvC